MRLLVADDSHDIATLLKLAFTSDSYVVCSGQYSNGAGSAGVTPAAAIRAIQ
jgi:hypothetical protein